MRSRTTLAVAIVATIFGILTVLAGSRVLLGADPGYTVYRPLLRFNTAMGFAYIVVGLLAWRGHRAACLGAAAIVALNVLALAFIGYVATTGDSVAATSLAAMTFRVVVWAVLLSFLAKPCRRPRADA